MYRIFMHTFLLLIFIIVRSSSFSNGQDLDDLKHVMPNFNLSSDCKETYLTPVNDFCSIVYLLFTEANQSSPYYFEPKIEEFNDCEFDRRRETKILIHGYLVKLLPGNQFESIKDALLSTADYNVIIVNWTRYNQAPYEQAVLNVKNVGIEVAKLINFLVREKGANAEDIHIIGHSLGAHIAGVAGQHVLNLGRITGLDPAFPLFETNISDRLSDDDANFVDVIHCSNGLIAKGFGIPFPIGYINFYPNGGDEQPACVLGRNYTSTDGEMKEIKSEVDLASCRHDTCPLYFLYSIQSCVFLSRECDSYSRYKMRRCSSKSHPSVSMGMYARKPAGIASHSMFYLKTSKSAPFCSSRRRRDS